MLTEKYFRDFERCFIHTKNHNESILEKSAMYCTAQWVCSYLKETDQITLDNVKKAVASEFIRTRRKYFLLDRFDISTQFGELTTLCRLIHRAKFLEDRAKKFYQYYLPCVVTDTSLFSAAKNTIPSADNAPVSCTMIHLALALPYANQGTTDGFSLLPTDMYNRWKKIFLFLNIGYNEFERYWSAVHYLESNYRMRKRAKVEKIVKLYNQYGVPLTMLLEQYAQAKNFDAKELRTANPWEQVQKKLHIIQERGMSIDEKLFNDGAYQISLEFPTEVIHSIFYKHRDDSRMESALIRTEIKRLAPDSNRILVVNPSPAFLMLFDEERGFFQPSDRKEDDKQIVFAVTDEVVAFLYRDQFRKDRFVHIDDVQKEQGEFDLVVILARDHELSPLWKALEKCKSMGNVALLVPQTAITDPESQFLNRMKENQICVDWILDVPKALTESEPSKKMLMVGRRGSVYEKRPINLLQAVTDSTKNYLSFAKEQYTIPPETLDRGLTLVQLRALAREAQQKGEVRQTKESLVYDFSEEIKICFNIIKVNGKVDRARAYYRNIHRPKTETNRSKGKRPNDIKTERGLRGKSEREIIGKLEHVALYDEYYDLIVADIKDYYNADLSRLTVKTMWHCCRKELLSRISYDENIALELFCGENQSLSNLISGDCLPENIATALGSIFGEEETGKKIWLQLHLIFQVAVEEGILERNPLSPIIHVVREQNRERIYLLNAALKKSHFTDREEQRMVDFLREAIPLPGRKGGCAPRYVVESKWLAGAISLFAGLPVREICPLLWGDLRAIEDLEEMQLAITKHLNSNDAVISNVNYGNREHYRKIAVDLILSRMIMERKQYLMSSCGYTEETLADIPIMLECEPSGRGRKKYTMITRSTVRKVNRMLLEEAGIESDVISLLDGDARFDVDLNAYRNDLFSANFRHKAVNVCGFSEGELCHHVGNKGWDTYTRHYCDYGNDFLQYDMVRKLYRWSYVYDPANICKGPFGYDNVVEKEQEYTTGRFAKGFAHADLTLKPAPDAKGMISVEICCEHGLNGAVVGLDEGGVD